jgi:hypothetical protein
LKVHLHQSLKIKSHKEVPKSTVEIKVFFIFIFLLDDKKIRILTNKDGSEDTGGPKTYGSYGSGFTTLRRWKAYVHRVREKGKKKKNKDPSMKGWSGEIFP